MKVLLVISALLSIASAGVGPIVIIPSSSAILRSANRDSAIVQSERLGGNFAYAIAEGQHFQTVSPLLASNLRAIENLGVSYALNPFSILAPATFLLQQPTSEEEQIEQQKQKDLLQKHRDELQEALDRQREEDERQLREQLDQQNHLNQQAIEQQKQLIELQQQWQQEQQNLIASAGGIVSIPIAAAGNNDQDANKQTQEESDDAIVVENASLTKDQTNDNTQAEEQPKEDQDRSADTKSDSDKN